MARTLRLSSTKRNYSDGKLVSIIRQTLIYCEIDGTARLEFKYKKRNRDQPVIEHRYQQQNLDQSEVNRKLIARCLRLLKRNEKFFATI